MNGRHIPVLFEEVIASLQLQVGASAIDGTLGGGGHTQRMLQAVGGGGRILGLDQDREAIERIQSIFSAEILSGQLVAIHSNFGRVEEVAVQAGFTDVAGILLDIGVSSYQIDNAERGLSFLHDGPLDMRMDRSQPTSAAELVNQWDEKELADVIYQYGEERMSRRIAKAIVNQRPLQTTQQLADLIERTIGRRGERIHPATRTFQALRIAVNRELEQLESVLPQSLRLLKPGGRMAIISFHSLEDRIVKQWMQAEASDFVRQPANIWGGYERTPTLKIITRKPIEASVEEIKENPRSRSAKLRVAEKI